MPRPPTGRRVVITGLGCVSPLGATADETWSSAIAGRSGVGAIQKFDTTDFAVEIAAQAPDEFEFGELAAKEVRRLDRFTLLALAAAHEAMQDAGLDLDDAESERSGVAIGSGIGGLQTLSNSLEVLKTSGPRRVSPFTIPMSICNMASGYVAIQHGLRGPNLCQAAACASGGHSIGESARAIERGDADVMFAGGSEAPITELAVAAFANMKALSTRNESPAAASRPFDTDRDGFVIGEGAAVLVLEDLERARARGANILAHVLGYGMTADAASVAQPTEDGEGAQRCMRDAIADAGLNPSDVDYLNAHATSTPQGDPSEVRAIRAVFGEHTQRLPVSATKSMTGHLLGAAGAVEALLCVRALQTGILPPTINLDKPDPECELDHVANKARETRIGVAISNSFGFGGTNAALVLGRTE
ncbi:MAG: beta-ketoacyl-ACP synthase II [Deltaproteobacteria bacterium]|nr:beta-ketoacyl-ACP synthase II [Deltaproteobacteria bacterium]MBW2577308.1 beta-ketoacyl-ACP synthase II [Deltaproteobacteria bacterium]